MAQMFIDDELRTRLADAEDVEVELKVGLPLKEIREAAVSIATPSRWWIRRA